MKTCPRCNKPWDDVGHTILRSNCGMSYRPQLNEFRLVFVSGFGGAPIANIPLIYWEADGIRCTYYLPNGSFLEITLPYLPFTITMEDLQKYMVLV